MVSDRSIDKHSNNWRQTGSHLNMNLLKTEEGKEELLLLLFFIFYKFLHIYRSCHFIIYLCVCCWSFVSCWFDVVVGIVCCRLQVCFMLLVSLLNEVHVCCRWHLAVNSNINIINF